MAGRLSDISISWKTHGLFNMFNIGVNSREGYVMNCRVKFRNTSGRLPFARSQAKPALMFIYT